MDRDEAFRTYKLTGLMVPFDAQSGYLQIYTARPNTVQMQYMVLFSHRTVLLPSVVASHQQEAAVWRPAPEKGGKEEEGRTGTHFRVV